MDFQCDCISKKLRTLSVCLIVLVLVGVQMIEVIVLGAGNCAEYGKQRQRSAYGTEYSAQILCRNTTVCEATVCQVQARKRDGLMTEQQGNLVQMVRLPTQRFKTKGLPRLDSCSAPNVCLKHLSMHYNYIVEVTEQLNNLVPTCSDNYSVPQGFVPQRTQKNNPFKTLQYLHHHR